MQVLQFQHVTQPVDTAAEERRSFSERLQQALSDAGFSADSPTQLAREFNLRFAGRMVTVHAARKWLLGEAIPTQEKLRALAHWLGVSAEWLRFGSEDEGRPAATIFTMSGQRLAPRDLALMSLLRQLDDERREVVHRLIHMLLPAGEA